MTGTGMEVSPTLKHTVWLVGSASTAALPGWVGGRIPYDPAVERADYVPGWLPGAPLWYLIPPPATSLETDEHSESATDYRVRPREIDQRLQHLIESAVDEAFEDGVESHFSRDFEFFITRYGEGALESLTDLITGERINAEIAAEILRWLGRIKHPPTRDSRARLLKRSLLCSSARARDGGLLGLASLNDRSAIPHLKQAIAREWVAELREDMLQVLTQLEENSPQWDTF